MLICNICGKVIEDYELNEITECHAHTCLGQSLEETIVECCECGGEFVEATECEVCGEWFDNSDLHGVCECCLDEFETVGNALAIGETDTINVEVNGFIANVLSTEQMNKILTKWVEENFVDGAREVVKYCEADKQSFSEWIVDKCKV